MWGAVVENKPVFGLPGHPSAMVVFDLLVAPGAEGQLSAALEERHLEFPLQAVITRSLHSAAGRVDFIRVKLSVRRAGFMQICAGQVRVNRDTG